jgi:hypothetical protein
VIEFVTGEERVETSITSKWISFEGRYIVVLYHMPAKQDAAVAKAELARREEELGQLKTKHDINNA